MRRFVLIIFFSLAFSHPYFSIADAYEKEIKTLSSALAESIVTSGKRSIAVVDFTDLQGNVTELGRFLAEEFSASLSELGKGFEVVDRTHIKSLLKEHQLAQTGLIDPQTARKLGEIAGVQALVTGTLTPFGDSIHLAVKVLDTATAKVIGASRGDIAKTKAIEELLTKGIDQTPSVIPQTPKTPPVLSSNSAKSKNVGMVTITLKKFATSQNEIRVALDFLNRSNNDLKLAINVLQRPHMVDEEGNQYFYSGGVISAYPQYIAQQNSGATILYAQSSNNVCLNFTPSVSMIGNWGSNFELSLSFILYDPQKKSTSVHEVSLSDITAQEAK